MKSQPIKKKFDDYVSTLHWVTGQNNEKGDPMEFDNHPFLMDIYDDQSQYLCVMKAAQIGMSTLQILKNHRDAKANKMDIIYTLPTDADVRVFVSGKVNRIIANNPDMLKDVADKDSIEQKQVGNSMIYFRGCFDEQTEILTNNGWKNYKSVSIGDRLPTLNLENKKVENDKVLDVSIFSIKEKMVKITNRGIDGLFTLDHRIVVSDRRGTLKIKRAFEINKNSLIPSTWTSQEQKEDYFVELLGWIITEGSYWTEQYKNKFVKNNGEITKKIYLYPRVSIIQKKYSDRIEKCLKESNISFYTKKHGSCVRFELSRQASKKIIDLIPEKKLTHKLINELPNSSLLSLWNGMMLGDGSKNGYFYQCDENCVDAFQYLCVLIGKSSKKIIRKFKRGCKRFSEKDIFIVSIRKTKNFTKFKINKINYEGVVWCPTTNNGTVFIRRDGKVYATGQTWTKKAAIMVTADRLVHDEKDSSKLDVVSDYQARLQHSKFKQIHTFSHPSLPEVGVDADWIKSDQKHWHITCPHCGYFHYMDWNIENPRKMSVDIEKEVYVCKKCKGELSDKDRACGQWVAKYPGRKWSGYWIPMLIAPWVSAADIVEKYKDPNTTDEFFYQKVLGLPYADASSKLLRDSFYQNLTGKGYAPYYTERVVIGVDTGLKLDYVMGDRTGLFYHGMCEDYDQLDELMRRWPKMIAVVDQGGDLIGSRKFYAKWPGRVYLCALTGDRNTKQLIKWSKKNESGACTADRNRMIQLCVDEFRKGLIPVHGTEDDWYEFWLDWNNLAKIKVLDPETNQIKGYKWVRNGRDHRALATVFWRVGISRFLGDGAMVNEPSTEMKTNSYLINPDNTVDVDLTKMFDLMDDEKDDWRKT